MLVKFYFKDPAAFENSFSDPRNSTDCELITIRTRHTIAIQIEVILKVLVVRIVLCTVEPLTLNLIP